jgi:uncharacterized phage protein (predicted DNA packaging)
MIVTLEEAKAHLRVDTTDDDALITGLIGAATSTLETWLSRPLAEPEPDGIKVAINLLVAHWYINTEAAGDPTEQMTLGVQELVAPYRVISI